MYCLHCGAPNPDQNSFCSRCGKPLQNPTVPTPPASAGQPGPLQGMRPISAQPANPAPAPSQSAVPPTPAAQDGPVKGFRSLNQSNPQYTPVESPRAPVQTPPPQPPVQQVYNPPARQPSGNVCPACSAVNPAGSGFCIRCGARLEPALAAHPAPSAATCSACGTSNPPGAGYCIKCGSKLGASYSQPTPGRSPAPHAAVFANHGALPLAASSRTWVIAAGIAVLFALICFFLPLIVISINNPFSFLYGGPEQIHISMSGMQILTMSSPSISGLGGLGETAENLYGELNFWQYMFESGDSKYKVSIILAMLAMLYLAICTIAGLFFTYKSYQTRGASHGKKMLVLGIAAVAVLIVSSLVVGISFNTGSSDIDLALDSVFTFSNGFGFWGMLVGFALFGFAGFEISKS